MTVRQLTLLFLLLLFVFVYLGKYLIQKVVGFFVHGVGEMLQLRDELIGVCVLTEKTSGCVRVILY